MKTPFHTLGKFIGSRMGRCIAFVLVILQGSTVNGQRLAVDDLSVTLLTSEEVLNMEEGTSKTVVIGQAHKNNGYFFGYDGSSAVSTLFGASMAAGQKTALTVAGQANYRLLLRKSEAGKYVIESAAYEGTCLTNKVAWEAQEFGWTAQSTAALASTSDMSADYDLAYLVRFSSTGSKSYLNSQGNITKWMLKDGEGEWSVWCVYEVQGDIPEEPDPEPVEEDPDRCTGVPAYRIPCGTFTAATYLTSISVTGEGVLGDLDYQPAKPTSKINIYTAQRLTVARGGTMTIRSTVSSEQATVYTLFADLDGDGIFEEQTSDLEAQFTIPSETRVMGRLRVRIDKNNGTANADLWGAYYDFPLYFADATPGRALSLRVNSTGRGTVSINGGTAAEQTTATFQRGDSVTIEAIPTRGYGFLGWQKDRCIISKSARLTLAMTDNKDLTALFGTANEYTIHIIGLKDGQEGGLVIDGTTLHDGDTFACSGAPVAGVDYTILPVEGLGCAVTTEGSTLVLAYFITDQALIDPTNKYQLICQRGTVHYKTGDTYLINTKTQDYPAENAEWVIEPTTDGYFFYNVGAAQYLCAGSSYALKDTPSDPLTIHNTQNSAYPFYLMMGAKYFNIGGSYQLVIDSWSTLDAGNQFRFVYVGEHATGLEDMDGSTSLTNHIGDVGNCYDLAGTRVVRPHRGIYITGGKKHALIK